MNKFLSLFSKKKSPQPESPFGDGIDYSLPAMAHRHNQIWNALSPEQQALAKVLRENRGSDVKITGLPPGTLQTDLSF